MKKRYLYRIEQINDCCIVYRTDNNYGRQGIVYKNGSIKKEYTPYTIPNYIVKECLNLLNN